MSPGIRRRPWPTVALTLALLGVADLSAGMASAPASATELRQRIEASGDHDHVLAVALARQALAGSLSPDQKAWFLDRLTVDQLRLRRWNDVQASAQEGLALPGADAALRVRFATQLGYAFLGLGEAAETLRTYAERIAPALPQLQKSADLAAQRLALDAQRMKGAALLALARKAEAMEQLTPVLRRYDELGDAQGQAETLHIIASLRYAGGDAAEAVRSEQQAIDAAERGQVKGVLPRLHSLMSYLQFHAGNLQAHVRELELARQSAVEEGDDFVQAMVMFNLSDGAMKRKDWAEALRLVDGAYPIFMRIGDLNMADLCLFNRGLALNRSGHREEGIALMRRADEAISKRPGQETTLVEDQKDIADELAFNRDFEQAYLAQVEYQRRYEALHQADNQRRIAEAEAAYQADAKQRQIETLKHEHEQQKRFRWLWVLAGVLGATAAAVAVVSRIYLKRAYRAMQDMALEDPLTGLHNRRYLSSRIGEELAQLRRQRSQSKSTGEHGAAFLLIDLDHFKSINDEHGHAAGDAVLKQASKLLRALVRQSDTIVRWGGEEFLVFARIAAGTEAGELAERIRAQLAGYEFDAGQGRKLRLTCSVGFACYPSASAGPHGSAQPTWEDVVSLADQCLYAAKASGRDLWVGLQYAAGWASLPEPADVSTGVDQGRFILSHGAGRDLRWDEHKRKGPAA